MSSLILDIKFPQSSENTNSDSFFLEYNTSLRFQNDKVNFENDEYYLLLDGIVLNKKQLLESNNAKNWTEYLITKYQNQGEDFFKNLKGSYYGFLFDKRENKWIVFTDHISSKPMFFYKSKDRIVFSNKFTELVNYLKKHGISITLNEQGAYLILSYGYVFEDTTITNEVKRLMVGYFIKIKNNTLTHEKFFTLRNEPIEISEKEAINEIDKRFRDAVELAFEKDKEYGYKHFATLSGGLDSRMTVWVAHELGYTNQLNLTFSQSNYLDETIAKAIAIELKHEWLFKALDNGSFLRNIDDTTKVTGGNVLYYGLAHGLSLYNYLNFENLGIAHSGQLAFALSGLHYSSFDNTRIGKIGDGAYSKKLLHRLTIKFKENYKNEEILKAYIRGFYGTNQGNYGVQQYTETYSPFYDIDFMEFALSVPIKMRHNHSLYKKWILTKYSKAGEFIWTKTRQKINKRIINVKLRGKSIILNNLLYLFLRKVKSIKSGVPSDDSMNPLNYWYTTNKDIAKFQDEYFRENIHLIKDKTLYADCVKLYYEGTAVEKNQVLSLLSASKWLLK